MNEIRLILPLLAAIGLLFSTSLAAYSQGHMAGSQSITICSPDGVHEILLGANGAPVPADHECADCCFISIDAAEAPNISAPAPGILVRSEHQIDAIEWLSRSTSSAKARSPPSLV